MLGGELAHGAVDRHARDPELAHQRLLGRDHVAFLPAAGGDLAGQVILDALENGRAVLRDLIFQTTLQEGQAKDRF